ncbi:MAG: SDR family NAD(P)-dependent oxidoreductase [Clostridiales Family XIII bacterium]|jgi:NAD(P)-dependent dehydrogenase (short-subunit alcohol dehydrogenase family)|nr:SDR family NAD(P)-dependent oxidoreductase [Clostridiales Family XIII bacterium]
MNAIVTGYGGIAYEVALSLAGRGYDVIIAGRDSAKGEAAAAKLRSAVAAAPYRKPPLSGSLSRCGSPSARPSTNIAFEHLDLFEPESIRAFAERAADKHGHIDIVMCIAGVMMPDELSLSSQGAERQFAVNYLGHFDLVGRLMPLLRNSKDPRVVTVSSVANRPFRFDLRDAGAGRGYRASISYALSKLCCLMYAAELSRREHWLKSCCVHPGFAGTQLFSRSGHFTMRLLRAIFFVLPFVRQTARAAAAPAVFAATSENAKSGAYYGPMFTVMGPPRRALMPLRAKNAKLREALWELSEKTTGIRH